MADISWVTPRLATGGAVTTHEDAVALHGAGIRAVLSCSEFDTRPLFTALPDVAVLHVPVPDDLLGKPKEWYAQGIAFALAHLSLPYRKVHSHCAAGSNRGPSMAFAVLVAFGWPVEDAEGLVRHARPGCGLAYRDDAVQAVGALGYV